MTLTKVQLEILSLMNSGWQLGRGEGVDFRAWLQKGGVGRGGETKEVRFNSFFSLWTKGYIEVDKQGFPTTTFKLTGKYDKGAENVYTD